VSTGERLPLSALDQKNIACFSGIARPESFENSLRDFGANLIWVKRFPDHYWFDQAELDVFYDDCIKHSVEMILTTEKDAVRLDPDKLDPTLPIYFLRIEVDILKGKESWDQLINRICELSGPAPKHEWDI
jgi:tetraacyldisaccharide 4'-kinase